MNKPLELRSGHCEICLNHFRNCNCVRESAVLTPNVPRLINILPPISAKWRAERYAMALRQIKFLLEDDKDNNWALISVSSIKEIVNKALEK